VVELSMVPTDRPRVDRWILRCRPCVSIGRSALRDFGPATAVLMARTATGCSFVPTGGVSLLTLVSRGRAPISLAGLSSTLAQWLALCSPKAPVHGVATLPLSLGCSATSD